MTRVVIDGRPLVGRRTGIGVHTAEIARRLAPPPLIASHAAIDDRSGIEGCRFRVDRALFGVQWQQLTLARVAREEGEVLWGPHGTLPSRLSVPAVVTVHDLTSITMPGRHKLKTIASFNFFIRKSLAKAKRIAAVSRVTADEVVRHFGIDAAKIEVVPNGVDPFYSPAGDSQASLPFDLSPRGYVLFVGTIEPRKGVDDLLTAWEQIPSRPPLVICGSLGWDTNALLKRIDTHPQREAIIVSGYLERSIVRDLYRHCSAFVYPSYYEGFGMPPLEAMACGAPVVTTRGGAIPEIVGDAAQVVEVGRPDLLAVEIGRVMRDERLRSELRERGVARAKLFNWDRSAEKMSELFELAAR